MGLDKIWFEEQGKITKEERDEEIRACVSLLDAFVSELVAWLRDNKTGKVYNLDDIYEVYKSDMECDE